ncbi:MAG: hypothetical protein Q8L56_16840 [Rhodocyclaceae bacterium]|nr:hypothetical protein [Rhodocyclaceae bacterium]
MTVTRFALVLCAGGMLLQSMPSAAAEPSPPTPPLGRLFMTPESRANLERQRQYNIQETRSLEGDTIRLDGVVVRSSGKSTVWVNNRPQHENVRGTGVVANPSRQRPDRATLSAGTEPPVDLKVGVTINQATRETSGGLAGGEIRVRK